MGKPPAIVIDPCGVRPAIPTNPLWHMGLAASGNDASYKLLQASVDWLTCQGKRGKPFDKDSKEFMHDMFEAFATGGNAKAWPEAARISDHYVNGKGAKVVLNPYLYQSSVIVKDVSTVMKETIQKKLSGDLKIFDLKSTDSSFRQSSTFRLFRSKARIQSTQGALLDSGGLLAEQNNTRLKNADNRFILQSSTKLLSDGRFYTKWFVLSTYDFEPFHVGHVTHIPLSDKILKVPDGLSEYLTHGHIGVAKVFDYEAVWFETWSRKN
jgi:hypothetical protein